MRKPCAWLLFISSLFFFFFYKLKKERLFFFQFACAFAEGDEVPDFAVSSRKPLIQIPLFSLLLVSSFLHARVAIETISPFLSS